MDSYQYKSLFKNAIKTNVLILFSFLWVSCADMEHPLTSIGSIFQGNTKKDPREYNLEDKSNYRKYRNYEKLSEKEKEEQIVECLKKNNISPRRGTPK